MIAGVLLDPAERLVIGHRGAAALAPENTIPSFDLALAAGARALELDVRATADGVPVVLHDPTLDRTTDGQGPIRARRLADLAMVDAGARFEAAGGATPFRDRAIRIPTLREVLERYREIPLLIEIKAAEAQSAVREELRRAGADGRVVVAAFRAEALEAFRGTPVAIAGSRRDILALKLASAVGLPPRDRGARAYAVPFRYRDRLPVPTPAFVRAAHRLGCPVHVWTVDDPAVATALWRSGVSGIITNHPGSMVEAGSGFGR